MPCEFFFFSCLFPLPKENMARMHPNDVSGGLERHVVSAVSQTKRPTSRTSCQCDFTLTSKILSKIGSLHKDYHRDVTNVNVLFPKCMFSFGGTPKYTHVCQREDCGTSNVPRDVCGDGRNTYSAVTTNLPCKLASRLN